MDYITIYDTHDAAEISILRNLFDRENIDHQVLGEATNASAGMAATGNSGMRLQVREEDREKAKEILVQSGFLGNPKPHRTTPRQNPKIGKGVIIFLAALVVVIVALLLVWFMNVE